MRLTEENFRTHVVAQKHPQPSVDVTKYLITKALQAALNRHTPVKKAAQ